MQSKYLKMNDNMYVPFPDQLKYKQYEKGVQYRERNLFLLF